jgi:hypothetical protein
LNASSTFVDKDVIISANALEKGDGGRVIIWADGPTGFYGTVNVNAGSEGGDGGFTEVSGKSYLDFLGFVNAVAPLGTRGLLLLDPANTTITANGGVDTNITFTACPAVLML